MILPDVNVLVYAFQEEAEQHAAYATWLEQVINGDQLYGLAELALSGFLRVVSHPRIFTPPTPITTALAFTEHLRQPEHCTIIRPGARHWAIFAGLCRDTNARGNLVSDAYLAALAIESGCEFVTADRDFARFKGLRWHHPLDAPR